MFHFFFLCIFDPDMYRAVIIHRVPPSAEGKSAGNGGIKRFFRMQTYSEIIFLQITFNILLASTALLCRAEEIQTVIHVADVKITVRVIVYSPVQPVQQDDSCPLAWEVSFREPVTGILIL